MNRLHLTNLKFQILAILSIPLLAHCGNSGFGGTSATSSPTIINVSAWDPKGRQRPGSSFNEHNVSALRQNGALGLIARSAKGPAIDEKFPSFLASAHREGLLLGAYHFLTTDGSAESQADAFVARVRSVARSRGIRQKILLVGDIDTHSSAERIVAFVQRVHAKTGVYPVIYLENSDPLKDRLSAATPAQKHILRHCPYWLALYSPKGTERNMGHALTPDGLTRDYNVWSNWSMWQYGGVTWGNGRDQARHYNTPAWRSSPYFGNLSHPCERNVFRGSVRGLQAFWDRHSIQP